MDEKETGLIQRKGKMLTELQRLYLDNPQAKIGYAVCRAVAKMCGTFHCCTELTRKYAMHSKPITKKIIEDYLKEEKKYKQTHYKQYECVEKPTSIQLFTDKDFTSHLKPQFKITTEANISTVRDLAVQFLKNNNLKVLKVELRGGNTPLITFE